jgi:site-specific DNA-methyltransferase (cytosine-N4-specific)
MSLKEKQRSQAAEPELVYETDAGQMYCGDTLAFFEAQAGMDLRKSVQLAFTSPPFPLIEKKKYGNLRGEEYIEWFASFAPKLRALLTADGSIVIEIGNAWERGKPVMSTVVLRALLEFLERADLHLCQEFVWYNPARLPSPVQWVNVERIRVKDAFSRIWWMSPVERPKADNRRVLKPYSASMKRLIETGKYNSGKRPSEYLIGKNSFKTDNAGAIPPNVIHGDEAPPLGSLLKSSNTRSTERYQAYCREHNMPIHPARMPSELVEFFVKFLTDENDLIFDPFGGSNTTGAVAENLGRRWISCEAHRPYIVSSTARFQPDEVRIISNSESTAIAAE